MTDHYVPITAADEAEILARMDRAQADADAIYARLEAMKAGYPADVRRLHDLAVDGTDAAAISVQILRALHLKSGTVDPFEMRWLDLDNKAAALRLIELCASPSMLSDSGLSGILSPAEIAALID